MAKVIFCLKTNSCNLYTATT